MSCNHFLLLLFITIIVSLIKMLLITKKYIENNDIEIEVEKKDKFLLTRNRFVVCAQIVCSKAGEMFHF